MERRRLGRTDIEVSKLCLGTMTWGEQNSEAEAHAQLDLAVDRGVSFIDTAELYPVPPKAETQGRTEQYIGSWLSKRGGRERVVLATKVVGPSLFKHFREGRARLDETNIRTALEASLKRLQTDYVDLYQLHWPERPTNYFGRLNYTHKENPEEIPLAETLRVLADLVKEGKIRHVGLSNETPWGVMHAVHLSEIRDVPRPVSIQNPYSLLNRSFEVGLAEVAHRESVGLLAYSPLAFGMLTGKYLEGARPEGARLTRWDRFDRYNNERGAEATARYVALARSHGLSPAQMALSFVTERPFVTSNIIGATSLEQLKENLASADLTLSEEVMKELETIGKSYSNPCP